eukprot:gene25722-34298_t
MRSAKVDFEEGENVAFQQASIPSGRAKDTVRGTIRAVESENFKTLLKLPPQKLKDRTETFILQKDTVRKSSVPKRGTVLVSDSSFRRITPDSSSIDTKEKKMKKKKKNQLNKETIVSDSMESKKRLKSITILKKDSFERPLEPPLPALDVIVPDPSIYSIDSSIESVQPLANAQESTAKKSILPRFSMFTAKVTQSVAASVANSILSGYGPQPSTAHTTGSSTVNNEGMLPHKSPGSTRMSIFSPYSIAAASFTTHILSASPSSSLNSSAVEGGSLPNKSPSTRMSLLIPQSMAASITKNILSGYATPLTAGGDGDAVPVPPSAKRFSILNTQQNSQHDPSSSVASSADEGSNDNTAIVPSKPSAKRFSMFTAQSMAASITKNILAGYVSPSPTTSTPETTHGNGGVVLQNPPLASKRLSIFSSQYTQSMATALTKNILSGYLPPTTGTSASDEASSSSQGPRSRSPTIAKFASSFLLSTLGSRGIHLGGEGNGNATLNSSSSASSFSPSSTSAPPSSLRRRLNSSIIHSKNMMLTSFSKLMNSSIVEEDEEDEEEEQDGEEGDEESNQDSESDSDDENSRDPSQLTAEEDSQFVAPPPKQPLKSEKRKNIMPASPSSSSLGQGGRAGLMGTFGALFSSSTMANSRVQRRVNRNKPSPEEILKNKIKIEEQLNLERAIKAARKRKMLIERKISQYKEFQAQLVNDAPSYETYARKLHQRVMLIERKDTELVADSVKKKSYNISRKDSTIIIYIKHKPLSSAKHSLRATAKLTVANCISVGPDIHQIKDDAFRSVAFDKDTQLTVTVIAIESYAVDSSRVVFLSFWGGEVKADVERAVLDVKINHQKYKVEAAIKGGKQPKKATQHYIKAKAPSSSTKTSFRQNSKPTVVPTTAPTFSFTARPTALPSRGLSAIPSAEPTVVPTATPAYPFSDSPSAEPSSGPSAAPSEGPTVIPTATPAYLFSDSPSAIPSSGSSATPSAEPTSFPTAPPAYLFSDSPSAVQSATPTFSPSTVPSSGLSEGPTVIPTAPPTFSPSTVPSSGPSEGPMVIPTAPPTISLTAEPSAIPSSSSGLSASPSAEPTVVPTATPSYSLSDSPSTVLSNGPSAVPSEGPTVIPTAPPTFSPSTVPSSGPSEGPTVIPTTPPTFSPSTVPSSGPSEGSTVIPTAPPTFSPSTVPSSGPSEGPTVIPTAPPTFSPSTLLSSGPSEGPTVIPTAPPTISLTAEPSAIPSSSSGLSASSALPTVVPTATPSYSLSDSPSTVLSNGPSAVPSEGPTVIPTAPPTFSPSTVPSS